MLRTHRAQYMSEPTYAKAPSNTSFERTRARSSAKPKRRQPRRSTQPLGGTAEHHMSAYSSGTIDREGLVAMNFTVASLLEQSEPWRVSQFVNEAEPWGFFAELEPPVPPLWSDHDLTGLVAIFTGIDGKPLTLAPTLRRCTAGTAPLDPAP